MAGTDNHRNSDSRRVNMKIWGGVPGFNRNLSRHQFSCPLVLRLLSYVSSRRRRRRKHGKNIFIDIWCSFTVINPYLFTKFHTSKHLVTQTCMFTLFFVVVRKGYCLPTSYQNVGVVSVIPTSLQSFMHPSIVVRELHKDAYSHCCLLWCEKGIVYQQVIRMLVSHH